MLAAMQFPTWIKPEIIPGLPLRWYGLMYVVAFAVTWFLFRYESRRREAPWTVEESEGWFFWAIVGLLIGARIFGTLVYDPTGYYRSRPWLIFWPFDESHALHRLPGDVLPRRPLRPDRRYPRSIAARRGGAGSPSRTSIAVSAPLGYTFGRLGNFINGELWGKVTSSPIGMIFPTVPEVAGNGSRRACPGSRRRPPRRASASPR